MNIGVYYVEIPWWLNTLLVFFAIVVWDILRALWIAYFTAKKINSNLAKCPYCDHCKEKSNAANSSDDET